MRADRQGSRKAVWGQRVVVIGLTLAVVSCGDLTRQGKASSYLIVDSLQGASGAKPDEFGAAVQSDVVTTTTECEGCVWEDPGQVEFRLGLKDPGPAVGPNVPTPNNYITVTRYRVAFSRADGRNAPGVDVPYPFDGAITLTVTGGTASAGFVLVRAQAKLEAPLKALRLAGGATFIATIAEITFYGHDQTGSEVSVTGTISVNFADWGDPGS